MLIDKALAQADFTLPAVLDSVVDGLLIADMQSKKFVLANSAICEMLGYSADEMSRLTVADIHPPEALADVQRHFDEILKTAVRTAVDHPVKRKDGSVFCATISASLMTIGSRNYAVGIFRDITERMQSEDQLRASEERFRAVSEAAQDAIIVIDSAGLVRYWNPAAERITGYSANEARTKAPVLDWLLPPRLRKQAAQAIAEFAATGWTRAMGQTLELAALRKDGSEFPVEFSLAPLQLAKERFAIAILRDITERKNAELALRTSEAQLSNALQIARAGHWVYDVAKDQFTFNDNFYRLFRTSAEEVGGYTMSAAEYAERFCHPDDRPVVNKEVAAAINSTEPAYNSELEHRVVFKGGEVGYIAVRIFAVKDENGKTIRTYGVNQDITARKRSEEALRRVNRTLRTLSSANGALVHATNERQLLKDMCDIIVQVGGYPLAWIGQRDENGTVRASVHAGENPEFLEGIEVRWDDTERVRGTVGEAFRTGETQINRDFETNPAVAPWRDRAALHGYRSNIVLPLKDRSGPFAVVAIYSADPDAFDHEEVKLLTELADDLSFGITALRDRAGRETALERLQRGLEATVVALATTVELRDVYTAGHQRRVSEIATAVARRMKLPDQKVEGIRLAGIIHDVGKIRVPAEILAKPGKLTPLEFELVKQHAQAGYDIVKGIDFPWPIADIILQHQERLDGSGYPKGLKADEIMIEAKILAVADVVEAMMSHRPYRAALGLDMALAEIERGKGIRYDPAAVQACIALFREDGFSLTGNTFPGSML